MPLADSSVATAKRWRVSEMKVLIVEDEPMQAEHAAAAVGVCGFESEIAHDGQEGLAKLWSDAYDIAIVDVEMPRMGGLDLIRFARQKQIRTYFVVLSSRTSPADKISGLQMGADDYLVKPISIDELSLRLRAIARRLNPATGIETLSSAGVVVNIGEQTVWRDGNVIELTPREKEILVLLMRNKGRCIQYDVIASQVWGPIDVSPSVVSANISRLRKKLAVGENADKEVIHTIRDFGYVFK